MFNLRFKCTVISSWYMVLHAVPKANKMIANKSSHSAEERFVYAKWIINYMRKHARTRTKVYGRENIPTQAGCFSCSLQTKTPIVPVALFDSYKSMNSNTFEKVDTQVHFLKPILYSEYGELKKKEVAELVKNRIAERMAQIKAGEINESYELIG